MMLRLLTQGEHLDMIAKAGTGNRQEGTAFEAFANYCAGIMIVGTATARRASAVPDQKQQVYFNGESAPGAFWRCIGLLEAGGMVIDDSIGPRLFSQMTLASPEAVEEIGGRPARPLFKESSFPVRLTEFRRIHRYDRSTTSAVEGALNYATEMAVTLSALQVVQVATASDDDINTDMAVREARIEISRLSEVLREINISLLRGGLIGESSEHHILALREIAEILYRVPRGMDVPRLLGEIEYYIRRSSSRSGSRWRDIFRAFPYASLSYREARPVPLDTWIPQ